MRILLSIDLHDPGASGASEWVSDLARWLAARGHQVDIVCEEALAEAPAGCRVLTAAGSRPSGAWARARRLQQLAEAQPRDLIHDTGACLLRSDILQPLSGSRLHHDLRLLAALPPRHGWTHLRQSGIAQQAVLQYRQMRATRHLVASSVLVARDFAQLGVRAGTLIRNGIVLPRPRPGQELAELRRRLGAEERLLVLLSSNNHYLKGVMSMLRALRLLSTGQRAGLRVVVAGHTQHHDFQHYIERHGLEECCLLTGWVADLEPYYQAADIFLHPTHHDAASLSTLKALASGCAVATTRWDGSADLISNEVDGLILPSNRPAVLVEALERLCCAGVRKQLVEKAALLAPALDIEGCFGAVETLYKRLLAR